jgi:hypothetical protein
MQTLVEIPDPLFRELSDCAASRGTTVTEVILDCVALRLRPTFTPARPEGKPRFPAIHSRNPGSLKLGEEGVYEYIPFP